MSDESGNAKLIAILVGAGALAAWAAMLWFMFREVL
jgi:hypothetical protein